MDDSLLNRAFEVEEISDDFDPSVPPSTGQEYLQHVMYEASQCPAVVVAQIDRKKLKNCGNVALELENCTSASELAPSLEWQQQQITMFSNLRRKIDMCKKSDKFKPVKLPKPQNEQKWHNMCIGEENSKLEPSLTTLLSMNESLLGTVLEYHSDWLECGLKPNQGKWIYALLACLNLPLTSDVCSAVRSVAKQCVRIRCTKTSREDPDVVTLNLIICLVSKYFGQTDLADQEVV